MVRYTWEAVLLCTLLTSSLTFANQLQLGQPIIEDNQYTFSVYLQGNSSDVAAMDFRFEYDPAVFRPMGVAAGVMAEQANKLVTANLPAPGDFKIVLMGLNQTALGQGEVARIALERIGDTSGAELRITSPTFATQGGEEVAASGSVQRLPGDRAADSGNDAPADEDTAPNDLPPSADDGINEDNGAPTGFSQAPILAELPDQLRGTLEAGAEVSGWDEARALAEASSRPPDEETTTSPGENPLEDLILETPAGNGGTQVAFVPPSQRDPERLAQTETGPVTIESHSSETNNSVPPAGAPETAGTDDREATIPWAFFAGLALALGLLLGAVAYQRRKH